MARSIRARPLPIARRRTARVAATLGVVSVGLVLPGAAAANPFAGANVVPGFTTLEVKGPKIKGFKLSGTFGASPSRTTGYLVLTRRSQGATESHSRGFEGAGSFDFDSSLSQGTVKAWPGGGDAVSLKFKATKPAKRRPTPEQQRQGQFPFKNCKGDDGSSRKGVLKGTLKIFAGRYFDTISLKKLKATVIRMPEATCDMPFTVGGPPPTAGPAVPELYASGGNGLYTVQRLGNGKTSHVLFTQDKPMTRRIEVMGDDSSFSYTNDAATATVTGVGSLLSGTLTYAADSSWSTPAPGTRGSYSGGITGKFATGSVRVPGPPFNPFARLTGPGFQPAG